MTRLDTAVITYSSILDGSSLTLEGEALAERIEKGPESSLYWKECRVQRMLAQGTFRGFGPLERITESDGAISWRTNESARDNHHHSG